MKISSHIALSKVHSARWWWLGCVLMALTGVLIFFWYSSPLETVAEASTPSAVGSREPIQPIDPITGLDLRKVDLGRKLFYDARLSHDNQISCASCHSLTNGGADGRARSLGIHGAVGVINSPTVFNSALNFSQFWDGRVPTLEQQIDYPFKSAIGMGSSWPEVTEKLKEAPEYVQAFRQVFGAGIESRFIKQAIAEFERSLSTPNSRFDRYLRHEADALSPEEQQGYQLFKSFGCVSCHQGVNIGGNMYQKLGIMAPYFNDRGHITVADRGRFNVTHNPNDLYMFKVPGLRNVALTAPYFHDASAATLPDAVRLMAKYQLGRHLKDQEVMLIVGFLQTLTGELNGKPL